MDLQTIDFKDLYFVEFNVHHIVAFSQFWRGRRVWSCAKDGRPTNGIHLLTRGHASYTDQEGHVTELNRDDIVYLPCGSRYSVEFTADTPTDEVRTILINFSLEDGEHRPSVFSPDITCLGHDTTGEFKTAFQDIRNTYRSSKSNLAVKSLFFDLLNKLSRRDIERDPDLEHCGDYIRQNLTTDLSVAQLAERYRVSETTFRKRFKEIYGVTPSRFINDCKMQLACELLRAGDISTEEIVRLLGFYDTSYFYKRMKASSGMTPADYRRTNRQRWEDTGRSGGVG